MTVDPDTKVGGGTAYISTQREVLEDQTGSHRAKRANFGRGVRWSSPGKFQKPTWQIHKKLILFQQDKTFTGDVKNNVEFRAK